MTAILHSTVQVYTHEKEMGTPLLQRSTSPLSYSVNLTVNYEYRACTITCNIVKVHPKCTPAVLVSGGPC